MSRLQRVVELLKSFFPRAEIVSSERVSRGSLEIIAVEARFGSYTLIVREIWSRNTLVRYGYQLLENRSHVLRYDNAPHHPELPTFPTTSTLVIG